MLIGTGDASHPDPSGNAPVAPTRTTPSSCGFYIHDHRTAVAPGRYQHRAALRPAARRRHAVPARRSSTVVSRNVIWTEIWSIGRQRYHLASTWASRPKFPAGLHDGHAQLWSWDYDPDDGWVYVVSTGFQRNKGIILRRVRPADIGDRSRYEAGGAWAAGGRGATTPHRSRRPVRPGASCRSADSDGAVGARRLSVVAVRARLPDARRAVLSPLTSAPLQTPVVGCAWDDENHIDCRVAQLYGGYLLPGSRLDAPGGVGLVVSHWNTRRGWPYRVMQFRTTLHDTASRRRGRDPADPINL